MLTFKFRTLFLSLITAGFCFLAAGSEDDTSEPREIVCSSPWDGSVYQVENYLEKNLKDPDSYEGIEWSPVTKKDDGSFVVRHKYRAKNSFGGYVIENKVFYLDSFGNVTNAVDF